MTDDLSCERCGKHPRASGSDPLCAICRAGHGKEWDGATLTTDPTPPTVDGPPCLRCGGDLADHILTAGPNGGDDEYRCLVDELSDVIADLETSDPPAEPGWIEVLRGVEAAYKRSLIIHEGPIVVDRAQHWADMATITEQVADEGGPLGIPTAFAVLRDIADAEPLFTPGAGSTMICVYCGADDRAAYPVQHLISCPWARAVQIVGVKAGG